MRHLMSHNGHLKTAIVPVDPRCFSPPKDFVRAPEALAARLHRPPRRASLHALAGHPPLREFPRGELSAAQAPAPGFLQRLRLLPLGRRSGRRDRRPRREPAPAGLVARATGRHVRGRRHASRCSWRCGAPCDRYSIPQAAFRRPDPRLRAGPDRHALSRLGGSVRLLPLFRQSGGTPGAVSVRLFRRRAPAPLRRHLHGAAARQFLAGRDRGSAKRTASIFRSMCWSATAASVEDLLRAALHAGLPRRPCARSWSTRASCSWKACRSSGMVDRRLALDLDLFSRGGMRVLDKIEEQDYDVLSRRPAISKAERVWLLLGSLARVALAAGGVMTALERILRLLPPRGPHARPEFLLLVRAALRASSATPCAPSTPSCAIATT